MGKKAARPKRKTKAANIMPISAVLLPVIHYTTGIDFQKNPLVKFFNTNSRKDCMFDLVSMDALLEGSEGFVTIKARSTLYDKNTSHLIMLPVVRFVKSSLMMVIIKPLMILNDPDGLIEDRIDEMAEKLTSQIQLDMSRRR